MTSDPLLQSEKKQLLETLFDGSVTLEAAEKQFKETFPAARYRAVSVELKTVCKELIACCDGPALLTALYMVDAMRRAECLPAKILMFDILVELEKVLRKDVFNQEQNKYAFKDDPNYRKSSDAIQAEELRVHSVVKVFLLDLLGGKVAGSTKAAARLGAKQDVLDAELDAWEKASTAIKEPLVEITHCWTAENEKSRCTSPLENGAVFDVQSHRTTAVVMRPAQGKIPSLPVAAGELNFLLPNQKSFLLFDGQAPSNEWHVAKKLLDSAAAAALTPEEQKTLQDTLTESVLKHLDVSDKMVCELAEHNPEVCAAVMTKLPMSFTSLRFQHLLTSKVARKKIETVVLNASKAMEQINIRTFITENVKALKENPGNKEALTSFFSSLRTLVTTGASGNKQLYIAKDLLPDLEQIVRASGDADAAATWKATKEEAQLPTV